MVVLKPGPGARPRSFEIEYYFSFHRLFEAMKYLRWRKCEHDLINDEINVFFVPE